MIVALLFTSVLAEFLRTLLTSKEIVDYLEGNGAENVVVINIKGKFDTFEEMIIASGKSRRHLTKLSTSISKSVCFPFIYRYFTRINTSVIGGLFLMFRIVTQLKDRRLNVGGARGVEGDKNDDWQTIDCYNCLVHLMLSSNDVLA